MSEVPLSGGIPKLLQELAQTAGSSGDAAQRFGPALDAVCARLGLDAAVLYRVSDDRKRLTALAIAGIPERFRLRLRALRLQRPASLGAVVRGEIPFATQDDMPRLAPRLSADAQLPSRRWIFLPLRGDRGVTGVAAFLDSRPRPFSDEEIQVRAVVAQQLAFTLAGFERLTSEERRAARAERELDASERILRATEAMAEESDLAGVLESLAQTVHLSFGRRPVLIDVYDERTDSIEVAAARGTAPDIERMRVSLAAADAVFVQAMRERRAAVVESAAPRADMARYLAVPLVVNNVLLGAIRLEAPDAGPVAIAREMDVIEAIAFEATAAMENARLYEQQRRSASLRAALNDVNALLSESLERPASLDDVLERSRSALRAEEAVLALLADDEWRVTAVAGEGPNRPERLTDGDVLNAREAVTMGAPLIRFEAPRDDAAGPSVGAAAAAGVLVVPLMQRDRVFGAALFRHHDVLSEVDAETLDFATKLGAGMSLAIGNLRLYEAEASAQREAKRELQTTEALLKAASALAQPTGLEEVLLTLSDIIADAAGAPSIVIELWDEQRRQMTVATANTRAGEARLGAVVSYEGLSAPVREVIETRRTMIADFDSDTRSSPGVAYGKDAHLMLIVPLVYQGKLLGLLLADEPGRRREWSPRQVGLIEGIAAQAAVAIENATLFEERKREADFAKALNVINEAVHSTLDLDRVLGAVIEEASRVIGLNAATIGVLDDGRWHFPHVFGMPEGASLPDIDAGRSDWGARLLKTGKPIMIEDALSDTSITPPVRAQLKELDVRSLLGVPLFSRGAAAGGLFFLQRGSAAALGAAELDFASKVASTLSLAIDNARLYASEHHVAETLQEALLSLPAEVEGIRYAQMYHSAAESARVGGDFYDLFELEHGLVGVIIGDISGKGVEAAVLTSLVKNTIRAHAAEPGKTPADVLRLTNTVLYRESAAEMFATVLFAILDRRDGRLVYCNAGHTMGAVLRPDGSMAELGPTSPFVGAFLDVEFRNSAAWLDVGDVLFLYTDGLTEARRDGELLGEERLFDVLKGTAGRRPAEVVAGVVESVVAWASAGLSDDLAVLAVERYDLPRDRPTQQKMPLEG